MMTRKALLATVSAAALGVSGAIGGFVLMQKAEAAVSEVTLDLSVLHPDTQSVTALTAQFISEISQSIAPNTGPAATLTATATGNLVENEVASPPLGSGNHQVEVNLIGAFAEGNLASNIVRSGTDLSGQGGPLSFDWSHMSSPAVPWPADGVGVVTQQSLLGLDADTGALETHIVTAVVEDNTIQMVETGVDVTGNYAADGNQIIARTRLNDMAYLDGDGNYIPSSTSIVVDGQLDPAFVSPTTGADVGSAVSFGDLLAGDPSTVSSEATLLTSSVQTSFNVEVTTRAGDATDPGEANEIRLELAGDLTDGTLSMEGNSIDASFTGNRAAGPLGYGNAIVITEDAGVQSFSGTLAVSSVQTNIDVGAGAEAMVGNYDSLIEIQVGGNVENAPSSMEANRITATGTGNLAFNRVESAIGIAPVDGVGDPASVGSGSAVATDLTGGMDTLDMSTDADVSLLSVQANISSSGATVMDSETLDASILFTAGDMEGSPLTLEGNVILAQMEGNRVGNDIALGGNNLFATAALGSLQLNDEMAVSSLVESSTIEASIGDATDGSNIALLGNAIVAQTGGSFGANVLSASPTNTLGSMFGPMGSVSISGFDGSVTSTSETGAAADMMLSSSQYAFGQAGSAYDATSQFNFIGVVADDVGNVTLDGNAIQASTNVNRITENTIALGGSTIAASGALVNSQAIGLSDSGPDDPAVSAEAVDNVIAAEVLDVDGNLSLLANAIGASVTGNVALGSSGGNQITVASAGALGHANDLGALATINALELAAAGNTAAYVIGSEQRIRPFGMGESLSLVATAEGNAVEMTAGDTAILGNVTAESNRIHADVQANMVRNAVDLSAANDLFASGAVSSIQTLEADVTSTAGFNRVRLDLDGPVTGNIAMGAYAETAEGVVLVDGGNRITALSTGNTGMNSVEASAGASLTTATPAAGPGAFADAGVGGLSAGSAASYALASDQRAIGDLISATADDENLVAVVLNDPLTGNVTSEDNRIAATAQANFVDNLVGLSAVNTVGATGALSSAQYVTSAVSALNDDSEISISGDDVTGNVTADGNRIASSAAGNAGLNAVTVAGSNIAAPSPLEAGAAVGSAPAEASYSRASDQLTIMPEGGAGIGATTIDALISIDVVDVTGNVLADDNRITATAQANMADNAIDLAAAGAITATAALASHQDVFAQFDSIAPHVSASVESGLIEVLTFDVIGNVDALENRIASAASGNVGMNAVTAEASNINATTAGTDSAATADPGGVATTVGDYALASGQIVRGGNIVPEIASVTGDSRVLIETFDVEGNVTAEGNRVTSEAQANLAVNDIGLTAQNAVTATAALASSQSVELAEVTADVLGGASVGPFGTGVTILTFDVDGNVDMLDNRIAALAGGNTGFNNIDVDAASITSVGDLGPSATANGIAGTSESLAAFGLASSQTISGSVSAEVEDGLFLTDAFDVTGNVTSDGNRLVAEAQANVVGNAIDLTAAGLIQTTSALASSQVLAADVTATVGVGGLGGGVIDPIATGVDITVLLVEGNVDATNNLIRSLAAGSVGQNATTVEGGPVVSTLDPADPVPTANASAGGGIATANADHSVASSQRQEGDVTADTSDAGVLVSAETILGNLTVADNRIGATAQGQQVGNALDLTAANALSATGAVASDQFFETTAVTATLSDSTVLAQTTVGDAVDPDLGGNLFLDRNALTASAGANAGVNTLTAATANLLGGAFTNETATALTGSAEASASYTVANDQLFGTDVDATVSNVNVLGETVAPAGSLYARDNRLAAGASGNSASNALLLGDAEAGVVPNAVETTGALASSQQSAGSVTASLTADTSAPAAPEGVNQGVVLFTEMLGSAASPQNAVMQGNRGIASAGGNAVGNLVDVTAAGTIAFTAPNDTLPLVSETGGLGGASVTGSGFALASTQSNTAEIDASITQTAVRFDQEATTGGLLDETFGNVTIGGLANGQGNALMAVAQANDADNRLDLASTNAILTTSGLANLQEMDGSDVTATAGLLYIGASVGTFAEGNIRVDGNDMAALAGVNRAANALMVDAGNAVSGTFNDSPELFANLPGSGADAATVSADHGLVNRQIAAPDEVDASLSSVAILVDGRDTVEGNISLTGNRVQGSTSGNEADNRLGVAGTVIEASTGTLNSQLVSAATIDTTVSDVRIGGTVAGDGAGDGLTGNADVQSNLVRASSTSNTAVNVVTIEATNALNSVLDATGATAIGVESFADGDDFRLFANQVDHALANLQGALSGETAASVSDVAVFFDSPEGVTGNVSVGGLGMGEGNTVLARNNVNAAQSQLTLTGENLDDTPTSITATGAIVSSQSIYDGAGTVADPAAASATASATVIGSMIGELLDGNIGVDGNRIGAAVRGNQASNALAAYTSGDLDPPTSDGGARSVSSVLDSAAVAGLTGMPAPTSTIADYGVANAQFANVDMAASVNVGDGPVVIHATVDALTGNGSVQANTIDAQAHVNWASSLLDLDAARVNANAAVSNTQVAIGLVSSEVLGSETLLTLNEDLSNGNATFANNRVLAQTSGSTGSNVLTVEAANTVTSTVSDPGQGIAAASAVLGAGTGPHPTEGGGVDFGVASYQIGTGEFTATLAGNLMQTSIGDDGGASVDTGNVRFLDNLMHAEVRVNNVSNTLLVTGPMPGLDGNGPVEALAAIANAQVFGDPHGVGVGGFVTASTANATMEVVTTSDVMSGNVTMDGNAMLSTARANQASNTLAAISGISLTSGSDPAVARAAYGPDGASAQADFTVANLQSVSSVNTTGPDDFLMSSSITGSSMLTGVGGALTSGNMSVSGNVMAATSSLNEANNRLILEGHVLGSTAALSNMQEVRSTDDATDPMRMRATVTDVTMSATVTGAVRSGNMTVDANRVQAISGGNTASNMMTIDTGTPWGSPSGNVSASIAPPATPLFSGSGANADYVVLNNQTYGGVGNGHQIQSSVTNATVALNNDGGLANGNLSVRNNTIEARATANSAINMLAMNGPGLGSADGASAAVVSRQAVNGTTIAASVSDSTIQSVSAVSTAGNTRVSGNRIVARATGNVAANSIGRGLPGMN